MTGKYNFDLIYDNYIVIYDKHKADYAITLKSGVSIFVPKKEWDEYVLSRGSLPPYIAKRKYK